MKLINIRNTYSLTLFLVQYTLILVQLIMGSVLPVTLPAMSIFIVGMVIGTWAILSIGKRNLNSSADVRPGGYLFTSGPYKKIRHPMYAAVLLVLSAFLLSDFGFFRLTLFCLLILNLILKMNYEERQLKLHYQEYETYISKTWRIIPYIF